MPEASKLSISMRLYALRMLNSTPGQKVAADPGNRKQLKRLTTDLCNEFMLFKVTTTAALVHVRVRTAGCIVTRCERLKHGSALDIPARACTASVPACFPRHLPCEPLPRPLIHARQPRPGATPGSTPGLSAPRTQPMLEKATEIKHNTPV